MSRPVTFEGRIRRLMRYRYPLLFAAVLNGLLVVGVPFSKHSPTTNSATAAASKRGDTSSRQADSTTQGRSGDEARLASSNDPISSLEPVTVELGTISSREQSSDFATAAENATAQTFADASHTTRPHGVGLSLWQLGMVTARASEWYAGVEKRDPFVANSNATAKNLVAKQPSVSTNNDSSPATTETRPLATLQPEPGKAETRQAGTPQAATRAAHTKENSNPPASGSPAIALRNPRENKLAVAFVAQGRVYVLEPGAEMEWRIHGKLPIAFDRGGSFGVEKTELKPGSFSFAIGERGWKIVRQSQP